MVDTTSGVMTALNVLTGLGIVLATIMAIAWGLKRFGLGRRPETQCLKIVDSLVLSPRERIVILEILDQWVIVGISANQMTTLHTMPKPEDDQLNLDKQWTDLPPTITRSIGNQHSPFANFTEILTAHLKRAVGKKKRDEPPEL